MLIYLPNISMVQLIQLADLALQHRTYYENAIGHNWFFKIYLN